MFSLSEWRLYENLQVISVGDSFDFPEDIGIDYETATSQAWELTKTSPIRILRDKELNSVAILNGQVVGVMFDTWQGEQYTFDVIIHPKFQQQGIGRKLIEDAMSNFRSESQGRPGAYIKAEVVNQNLIPLLTRMGFKLRGVSGGITIMTYGRVSKSIIKDKWKF